MSELSARMGRIIDRGPIPLESVDFTIVNPELLKARLEPSIQYAHMLETEVPTTAASIHAMLPNMSPAWVSYLDEGWVPQELGHSAIEDELLDILGVDPLETRNKIPPYMSLIGRLGSSPFKSAPKIHGTADLIFRAEAAIHEREVEELYLSWARIFGEMGETPLQNTFAKRVAGEEGGHYHVFDLGVQEIVPELDPWQKDFAHEFIRGTMMPVGVRVGRQGKERRMRFGHAALDMAKNGDVSHLTDPAEDYARTMLISDEKMSKKSQRVYGVLHHLLGRHGDNLDHFMRSAYQECIEEFKANELAAA